jgi:uncharacterized protein YqhQ
MLPTKLHIPTWYRALIRLLFLLQLEELEIYLVSGVAPHAEKLNPSEQVELKMTEKVPSYGGQAVIEGVMMRGAQAVAIAMRDPKGEIVLHTEALSGIYKSRITKIPFLRGLVALWDALGLGMRALTISANTQTGEDEKLEGPALWLTLGVALLIGIGLFLLAPALVGQLFEKILGGSAVIPAAQAAVASGQAAGAVASSAPATAASTIASWAPWLGNLMEGLVRLALLVGYIWGVGRLPDIRRVFSYHGAEHKTINAFEAGRSLPQNASHATR